MDDSKPETIDEALTRIGLGKFQIILFLVMGLIHSCDSMEMMILVFLGPFLTCSWKITISESSLLIAFVFIGNIVGLIWFGKSSDTIGRKITLILSNSWLLYFGLICAVSPTFSWLVFIRFLVGIGLGGNASNLYTMMSEMTPIKYRGMLMILFEIFWIIGSYIMISFSFLFLPLLGWRMLMVITTIPVAVVLLSFLWIPESPRMLLLQNNKAKCIEVINKIAKMNNAETVSNIQQTSTIESSFRDLIHPNYLLTTIILCFTMFTMTLTYCSILLISTIINGLPHRCLQDLSTFSRVQIDSLNRTLDDSCCFTINWESYKNMLISTAGEFIMLPISFILLKIIGRKIIILTYTFIVSILVFILNFCISAMTLYVLLFFIRGCLVSLVGVILIYVAEIYPTSVRSLGAGVCGSSARIGGIVSPFLVNILIAEYSFIGGIVLLSVLGLATSIAVFKLPYETKDHFLIQTAHDMTKRNHLFK